MPKIKMEIPVDLDILILIPPKTLKLLFLSLVLPSTEDKSDVISVNPDKMVVAKEVKEVAAEDSAVEEEVASIMKIKTEDPEPLVDLKVYAP